jgi:hypothetical protein
MPHHLLNLFEDENEEFEMSVSQSSTPVASGEAYGRGSRCRIVIMILQKTVHIYKKRREFSGTYTEKGRSLLRNGLLVLKHDDRSLG